MLYNFSYNLPFPSWVLVVILLWAISWKGYALWKSARNGQKEWFVVLLVVNTLAILEILYLKFWQKKTEPCCEQETCCEHETCCECEIEKGEQ